MNAEATRIMHHQIRGNRILVLVSFRKTVQKRARTWRKTSPYRSITPCCNGAVMGIKLCCKCIRWNFVHIWKRFYINMQYNAVMPLKWLCISKLLYHKTKVPATITYWWGDWKQCSFFYVWTILYGI